MTTTIKPGDSLTAWCQDNARRYDWTAAADNHEPTRDHLYGELFAYENDRGRGWVIYGLPVKARGDVFLIDDGRSVQVAYTAAWHPEGEHIIAHPMPTDYDAIGEPIMRADDPSRQVDYTTWQLGPRRAWHIKARPAND